MKLVWNLKQETAVSNSQSCKLEFEGRATLNFRTFA